MIQVYSCDFVPKKVPEFVDPHITVDTEGGREIYLIEVNLNHPLIMISPSVTDLLKSFGFLNPVHLYTGERPRHLNRNFG